MPTHTHLIAVPKGKETMRKAILEAYRLYARIINLRQGWRGYLWQGRFTLFMMDERYLLVAIRPHRISPEQCESPYRKLWWCACNCFTFVRGGSWLEGIFERWYSGKRIPYTTSTWTNRQASWEWIDVDTLEDLLGMRLRKKKAGPKGQWKNRENK